MTNKFIAEIPQTPQAGIYNSCRGSLYVIQPQQAENLIINPSFELDTYNWTGVTRNITKAWSGFSSGSISTATPAVYGGTIPLSLSGGRYTFSCYAYLFSNYSKLGTPSVSVRLYSGITTYATWNFQIKPGWQRLSGTTFFTVTASCGIEITCTYAGIEIDAVQFERAPSTNELTGATTYFDGTFTGTIDSAQIPSPLYTWRGRPHRSTSLRSEQADNGGAIIDLQARFGFELIGIVNADGVAQNNQIVQYRGTDGSALQDIIIPDRTIQIVGRIYASTTFELQQKIASFQKYFARDTTAYRQPKSFIFQNTDGDDTVGIPLTFSGVIEGTMQIPVARTFETQVSLQIRMLDPYFYGHDEGQYVPITDLITTRFFWYQPNWNTEPELSAFVYSNLYAPGTINGNINAYVEAYDGSIIFGGTFTQIGATSYNFAARYYPTTNTFGGLGTVPSTVFNGSVSCMVTSLDKRYVYIGGTFTTAGGITANRIVLYNIEANTFSVVGGGVGGGVNGEVTCLAINTNPNSIGATIGGFTTATVYLGGAFTATTTAINTYRIAYLDTTTNTILAMGTNSGFNATVRALSFHSTTNRLYIGGDFTTSNGGAANAFPYIAYVTVTTIGTTVAFYTGMNNSVRALYTDQSSGNLYAGGDFTATFAGATLKRIAMFNGSVWSQLDTGFDDGNVLTIIPHKNGLFIGGGFTIQQYSSTILNVCVFCAFYNGQGIYAMPYAVTGIRCALSASDGRLYLGGTNINTFSSNMAVITSSSTAASHMTVQVRTPQTATSPRYIYQITNETQQVSIPLLETRCIVADIVTISTKTQSIVSDAFGNLSLNILDPTGITNARILPGYNLVCVFCNPVVATTEEIVVIWRQTFTSIFDGVSAP